MTKEEAEIIFKSWREYQEINEKFNSLMLTPPESFLPYPVTVLEEALNIVAKKYFDTGDQKMFEAINTTMGQLSSYYISTSEDGKMIVLDSIKSDEDMLKGMKKVIDLTLSNQELKETLLQKLKKAQNSWLEFRKTGRFQK